jgi:hypothetical protein
MIEDNILIGTGPNDMVWTLKPIASYREITRDDKGRFHSFDDKPALVENNNSKIWAKHGAIHRDNDMPAIMATTSQQKIWCQNGLVHREKDRPALSWPNQVDYILFNCSHRIGGPSKQINYFSLYDYKIYCNRHALIVKNAIDKNLPLHVSFLQWYLNVPNEDINQLINLVKTVPLPWVLKAIPGRNNEVKPLSSRTIKYFSHFVTYENKIMESEEKTRAYFNVI